MPQCLSLANDKDSRKGAGTDARATSESFRTRLPSYNLFHPEAPKIQNTRSKPPEGKSTISCHFAAAEIEADPEKQVIVVDLDLRRPRIGEYLQLDNDHPGVYEVLAGKATLKEAIQKTDDGYDVIAAGKTPGRNVLPNEALIEKLLTVLQKKYDRIIIDSAPRLAVSDTLIISRHVDMLCLVFRMWKTPRKALSRAIGRLEQNQTLPAGVVANYMPAKKLLGQANYYYSYSNAGYSQYSS
ncbi:MAG: CpsD/CapB family tyrosine-protein kinase [Verrucomicrobiota bacterium]